MNNFFTLFFWLVVLTLFENCTVKEDSTEIIAYPEIKGEPDIKSYFGKKVDDEFHFLENLDSPNIKKWYVDERAVYDSVMVNISGKDSLTQEFRNLFTSSNIRASIPRPSNKKIFFYRFFIKEQLTKLTCTDTSGKNEIDLFQRINSSKKKYSIDYCEPSFEGNYAAFGLSTQGSEMATLYVVDTEKKKLLSDSIQRCLSGYPNWLPDDSGFFYNQLMDTKKEEKLLENSSVKLHIIGTDPRQDKVIFSKSLNKNLKLDDIDFPYLLTFPSSDKVLAVINHGSGGYPMIYISDLMDVLKNPIKAKWQIVSTLDDKVSGYSIFNRKLFLLEFKNNSNGSLEVKDLDKIGNSKILLEGKGLILQEIFQNKNSVYCKYLNNGINGLIKIDPNSLLDEEVKLLFNGAINFSNEGRVYAHSNSLYVGLESWINEWAVFKYDNNKFLITDIRPKDKNGDPLDLISEELEVPSYDGTLVPLSIVHRKDLKLDGKNPTLLRGYGAYGTSLEPHFESSHLIWFKRGGIIAVAHVRGGGEKGDQWYKAGFKATKSNSWKDFIACSEYLIKKGYTSPNKLAALGTSAGGITVGMAIMEKPELFKTAIIRVGALNAIRAENSKNTFTVTEFGTNKDSLEFQYLFEMDVYHHLKDGVKYPSMYFTAGLNDHRVAAWEPGKVVAKMQKIDKTNVVLFKVTDQGHFGDGDLATSLGEMYSFLFWQLGYPDFKYNKK